MAGVGHNSRLTREELEHAFRERTRAQRIKEETPFDLQWQWEVWLSDLGPHGKLVAFAIRIFGNGDGSACRPSIETIMQMTGLSRQTVVNQLRLLEKALLIVAERGKGRGGNAYNLVIPRQTLTELATVVDIRNGLPIRPNHGGNSLPSRPFTDGNGLPSRLLDETNGLSIRLNASGNSLIDDGNSLLGRPDLTIDLTKNKKGEVPREGSVAKVASALAAGIAATITPAAAAMPEQSAQVVQVAAECWQTPKARMDAGTNVYEKRSQAQVWMTPYGVLEVAGEFRAELEREFPLVALRDGLHIAAARVRIAEGALMAMREIRKQFSYLQRDAVEKQKRAESYAKKPDDKYGSIYDGVL
jgi:hypothetical protein